MKVALYARVSTDNTTQDETLQLPRLREMASRRDYEVVAEYTDKASAKDGNRPAFKDMMVAASRHEFDAIMATKLDRIMRSVVHLSTTMEQLEVYNVALIFGDLDINPRTPNGQLVVNVVGAIAQWERQIISSRTSEGMQARKARGTKFGKKVRDDIPIKEIARMRIDGKGWAAISKEMNIPKSTILDRRALIEDAKQLIEKGSDNVPAVGNGSEREGVF